MKSLAPWFWLIDFPRLERALDASGEATGELSASLAAHFASVDVLRSDSLVLEGVCDSAERLGGTISERILGTIAEAPWAAERFDCIALHDQLSRSHVALGDLPREFGALRRLLRPNGWLSLAFRTSPLIARTRSGDGVAPKRLRRLLLDAGFAEARCLFVEPSLDSPLLLLPDNRQALVAYEASADRGANNAARRAAARLGLWSLLYPAYFMLARA